MTGCSFIVPSNYLCFSRYASDFDFSGSSRFALTHLASCYLWIAGSNERIVKRVLSINICRHQISKAFQDTCSHFRFLTSSDLMLQPRQQFLLNPSVAELNMLLLPTKIVIFHSPFVLHLSLSLLKISLTHLKISNHKNQFQETQSEMNFIHCWIVCLFSPLHEISLTFYCTNELNIIY